MSSTWMYLIWMLLLNSTYWMFQIQSLILVSPMKKERSRPSNDVHDIALPKPKSVSKPFNIMYSADVLIFTKMDDGLVKLPLKSGHGWAMSFTHASLKLYFSSVVSQKCECNICRYRKVASFQIWAKSHSASVHYISCETEKKYITTQLICAEKFWTVPRLLNK